MSFIRCACGRVSMSKYGSRRSATETVVQTCSGCVPSNDKPKTPIVVTEFFPAPPVERKSKFTLKVNKPNR